MTQEPLTLYKLIVLYMLDQVDFPLTGAQVSDFILTKEYTSFLTLQQAISELNEAGLIATRSIGNRTNLLITGEGKNTLSFFENRISDTIKKEVVQYLKEKEKRHQEWLAEKERKANTFEDKTLNCKKCGNEFLFSANEQKFFKEKGFFKPSMCKACRASIKTINNFRK